MTSTTNNTSQLAALAEAAMPRRSLGWYMGWAAVVLVLAASWTGADMRPMELLRDSGNMAAYASEFFPPNFGNWQLYVDEMLVTLQIAVWGTALAVLSAIPLSLLASSNIVPWWVYQPVRRVLDACSAINEMALWIHTAGTLAKLFSEAVEAIDPHPVEGIRSTGASSLHEIVYGVIPQVMPLWISYTLYRFEANVRSASVVGMVGAGGIGVVLWEIIRGFQYAETAAVMIIIIVTVSAIDLISASIRKLTL